MSRGREVIVLSLESWADVWRRNRYVVSELLKARDDLRVIFIEPPLPGWRSLRAGLPRRTVRAMEPGRLWVVTPIEWVPDRLTPFVRPVAGRGLRSLAAGLGFSEPVLWVNNHSMARDATATGWPIVYDVTDDWLVFGSGMTRQWRARRDDELLLDRAHTVIVCSPALARRRGRNRQVVTIENGIDLEQFSGETARPLDLPRSPTAVYVGTLHDARIELRLCEQIADALPEVTFAYVGPDALTETSRSRLSRHANVRLLGPKEHSEVAAYYQHADVVIVPHVVSSFTESLDPIKAREILAAGTPTVTTAVAGMRELGPPVRVASLADFADSIRLALTDEREPADPGDLAGWGAVAHRFGQLLDAAAGSGSAGGGLRVASRQPRETRSQLRIGFIVAGELEGTSGIERYSSELLGALARRDDMEIVPIIGTEDAGRLGTIAPGVDDLVLVPDRPVLLRSLVERYLLTRVLASRDLDLVHGTKHILPRGAGVSVLTVHDLYVFTRSADYRLSKRLLLPAIFRRSLAQAHRLIAVSSAVADELVTAVKSGSVVDVIPEAPAGALFAADAEEVPSLAGAPFALCVSDLSSRKNVGLLVRIWPEIHSRSGLLLALVGPDRNSDPVLARTIDELVAAGQVTMTGRISDGALRWCYEMADIVLIPSFEEGFGLPAIEAVAFGAPLLTSNDRTLVELTGPEVPHLDPSDERVWVETILSPTTRGRRSSAPVLTWDEVAEATVEVYRAALRDAHCDAMIPAPSSRPRRRAAFRAVP